MMTSHIAMVLGLVAAAAMPAHAESHRKALRAGHHSASGMQVVATGASNGWQYFSNAREGRAVVISPKGEYFYSRGKGLELVFKAPGAA